jgi:hypothetical protein
MDRGVAFQASSPKTFKGASASWSLFFGFIVGGEQRPLPCPAIKIRSG